ncbi:MAG: tetratricopeptide repeat protein [Phycisphaerales bacterium]
MNFDSGFEQNEESSNCWDQAEQKAMQAFELYEDGKMNEALSAMNEALEINPANDRWHFNKALTLDAMERFEEAIDEYKSALELNSGDIEILNCLAVDYTRTGQYDLALDVFGQIEKIDSEFEPGYCNRIITYTEMGNYEMAEQMFYLAQQINDSCPLCFYNIGNSFFIQGNYKKAVWCWQRTALIEPNHPQINYHIAQGFWNLGQKEHAKDYFILELRKNPGDKDVLFDFGLFLLNSGDTANAAEKFHRILELSPQSAPALFYLGEIEYNAGRQKEAVEYYQKAMKYDANMAGPRFRLAQIAYDNKDKEKAFSLLAAELELDVRRPEILEAMGLMMVELEQTDYATHCFLRVSELEPVNANNYYNLGKVLAARGEMDDAQQFLDYAIELDPTNYELIKKVMLVYLSVNKPQIVLDTFAAMNLTKSKISDINYIKVKAYLKMWLSKFNKKRLPCG